MVMQLFRLLNQVVLNDVNCKTLKELFELLTTSHREGAIQFEEVHEGHGCLINVLIEVGDFDVCRLLFVSEDFGTWRCIVDGL